MNNSPARGAPESRRRRQITVAFSETSETPHARSALLLGRLRDVRRRLRHFPHPRSRGRGR
jgi:hypothetical protein